MRRHALMAAALGALASGGAATAATIDLSDGEAFYTADTDEFIFSNAYAVLAAEIAEDGTVVSGGIAGLDADLTPFSGTLAAAAFDFDAAGEDVFSFLFTADPFVPGAYQPAFRVTLIGEFGTGAATAFLGDFSATTLGEGSELNVIPLPAGAVLLASALGLLGLRRL